MAGLSEKLKQLDDNQIANYLKELKNAAKKPLLQTSQHLQEQVNIRPNKSVSTGKFKPDPLLPGGYIAHPQTIAALKKNIFMAGDSFEDLEQLIECEGCKHHIDQQFWSFCPYCGEKFRT